MVAFAQHSTVGPISDTTITTPQETRARAQPAGSGKRQYRQRGKSLDGNSLPEFSTPHPATQRRMENWLRKGGSYISEIGHRRFHVTADIEVFYPRKIDSSRKSCQCTEVLKILLSSIGCRPGQYSIQEK